MKAAFLFDGENQSYTFNLIARFHPDELDSLDTLVWTGLWGLCDSSIQESEKREELVSILIFNREGSRTEIAGQAREVVKRLAHHSTFAVVLDSIDPRLATKHHQRLTKDREYCGVVEVLANSTAHQALFQGLVPTARIENGKVFVLHQDENDEDYADQLIKLAGRFNHLGPFLEKKVFGLKFSVFDEHSENDVRMLQLLESMDCQWRKISERVVYKLRDMAPEILEELTSSFEKLDLVSINPADAASVAVNLRRCVESLVQLLHPQISENGLLRQKGDRRLSEHVLRTEDYIDEKMKANMLLARKIKMEFKDINELLNKGVHEGWLRTIIRPLSVRVIVLLHTLLHPVEAGRLRFNVGDDLFD